MVTVRQRRINELLTEELGMLVPGRMDDPDLTGIRITRAEVTQDLATAKVFYMVPEDSSDAAVHAALDRAQGYLRGQLASLGLRRVPRLVFARDRDYEEGQRVLDILATLTPLDLGDEPEGDDQGDADDGEPGRSDPASRGPRGHDDD